MRDRLSRSWFQVRQLWSLAIVKGVIGGLLSFLVITAISGLIQDAFPKWVRETFIPWLSKFSVVPNWLLVVAPAAGVGAIIIVVRLSKLNSATQPISEVAVCRRLHAL